MRMKRRGWLKGLASDERGATAVVVALATVLLLGMLGLAFDGGIAYLQRRRMVNAADAAALAAAQSYARNDPTCGVAGDAANAKADSLATANVSNALPDNRPGHVAYDPQCGDKKVTTSYYVVAQHYFIQIIGADSSGEIAAHATATWGAAGGDVEVMPLMLSAGRLSNCGIPDSVVEGDTCRFWWNNSPASNPVDLTSSEWAAVDLSTWNVSRTGACPGNSSESDLTTYVCRGNGNFGNALNKAIVDTIGETVPFPVNDPEQQVDSAGNLCRPQGVDGNCAVAKYAMVGFATLTVTELWKGNNPQNPCTLLDGHPRDANARCLVATWKGYSTDGLDPGGGEDFGTGAIGLAG